MATEPQVIKEDKNRYDNFFVHCGQWWVDTWSCQCNDRCPVCHHEIEPFMSIDNLDESRTPEMHVGDAFVPGADFTPEGGWPAGITNLEELKVVCVISN